MTLQLLEGLGFDLADTLSSYSELLSDFFERMNLSTIEPESHDDDFTFARSEEIEHLVEIFFEECQIGCLVGSQVFVILYEVSESRVFFSSDRGVE